MLKRALVFVLIILVLSGCSKSASTEIPATPSAISATPATFPTLPAQTPTVGASPTPFTAFNVKPGVDNLNVRMNPGYLFDALLMVQQTDTLTVLGKAPGGEWINVKTADGVEGWVFAELLQSAIDLGQAPLHEPKDVVLIKGRVLDATGTPIQGVGFNVSQDTEAQSLTNAVITDANGDFYSFMPATASGTWTVTYTAIACKSNVWSDSTCATYKSGYTGNVDPQSLTVSLPQGSPLAFMWK